MRLSSMKLGEHTVYRIKNNNSVFDRSAQYVRSSTSIVVMIHNTHLNHPVFYRVVAIMAERNQENNINKLQIFTLHATKRKDKEIDRSSPHNKSTSEARQHKARDGGAQ